MDIFDHAEKQRDEGMKRALDHAEENRPGWADEAYRWIGDYAKTHRRFISEECTDAAAVAGLTSPADPRAWGGVFQKAARDCVIRKIGFGVSKRRHLSPTPLWESLQPGDQS